jgi:hypothetical protein
VKNQMFAFQAINRDEDKKTRFSITGKLPHIEIAIGDEEREGGPIFLKGAVDSCAGGTIGYRPYHEHIKELYPDIVYDFIDYKKSKLPKYYIGGVEKDGNGAVISAEIIYHTPYIVEGRPVDIVIGLSDQLAANTIYGIPLQEQAKFIIDLERQVVISSILRQDFPITFHVPIRNELVVPQDGLHNKVLLNKMNATT